MMSDERKLRAVKIQVALGHTSVSSLSEIPINAELCSMPLMGPPFCLFGSRRDPWNKTLFETGPDPAKVSDSVKGANEALIS